uniref:Jacalin-type lectin domain-containing protein n=1 Tax=Phytophthora ramorum TaxID=164328 RepID=H3GHP3_PHYRM
MAKLFVVLVLVFVAIFNVSAQSFTFNASAASVPAATVTAANYTVNTTATVTFQSTGDEDSDDESVDSEDDIHHDGSSSDSDDESDSALAVDGSVATTGSGTSSSANAGFTIGNGLNATSTIDSTYKNWIGSALGTAADTACYREAYIAKTCPIGFDGKLGTCWAQCPFTYPVECGLECIRQNDDCALAVVSKVSAVAQAALSVATYGVYGEFKVMAKGIQIAFKCGKEMMGMVKSISKYVRTVKVSNPQTTKDQLLTMLYQTDNVVFDVPVTIAACLGIKVDEQIKTVDRILNTAELALKEIIANGAVIVSSWSAFTGFMKNITLGASISSLNESDITSLETALKSNSTCGYDMKRLLDRTWMTVAEMRRQNPAISEDDIRVAISQSNLALYEIPTMTNNCMEELIAESDEATAYKTRDTLRKGIGGIMDDLISSGTSNNGTLLTAGEYMYKIADKVATFYAVWERKNIGGVLSEFFQTICGPTEFIGDIDDGTAEEALGLKAVDTAFNNSAGNWTKIGDGTVTINFQSTDTEDVTVNIKSGGNKFDKVAVAAGQTVTWTSNMTALGGKTLYLDRWRPGFLGLPGTGGGSLLLWVPRSTQGGNLQLHAMLNVS